MKERLTLMLLGLGLLATLGFVLLVGESYVKDVVARERAINYTYLGPAATAAEDRAERWYRALFLRTHITQSTFKIVGGAATQAPKLPAPEPQISNTAEQHAPANLERRVDGVASKGLDWCRGRLRVFWSTVFQLMVRLSTTLVWLPLALLVLLPVVIDALVVRRIKATNFSITSPHMQLFGTRSMTWLVCLMLLLQMAPWVLHPILTPVLLAVFCGASWIGITQFAKRA